MSKAERREDSFWLLIPGDFSTSVFGPMIWEGHHVWKSEQERRTVDFTVGRRQRMHMGIRAVSYKAISSSPARPPPPRCSIASKDSTTGHIQVFKTRGYDRIVRFKP